MKYVLQDLLRVREFRETAAGSEVKKKKSRFDHAQRTVTEKEKALSDYHTWRLEKEDSLYDEIANRLVTLKDLDDLKMNIALLREKETALENDLLEAQKALNLAAEELEEAKDAFRLAIREKRKIEEHKTIWIGEAVKEEERAQDKEMEEFQKMMKNPDQMEVENDENF